MEDMCVPLIMEMSRVESTLQPTLSWNVSQLLCGLKFCGA